ncbi:dihydrofolate reductase family protein [Stackebrandtia soli]|uniref:dihydrofolate reductase family protein n=1 Tax=Stackebrandtia soli TaxID=1892856 RepID=UPI0039E9992A
MTRTIYYTATSLDGFIATPDHSLEWLLTRDTDHDGPMGYNAFIADVGAMVMGASTYQWILDHDPEGFSYDVPCWVFTHRDFPRQDKGDVRFTQDAIKTVHGEMAAVANGKNVWVVGGGDLAGQFADHGLLDELIVSIAPVTLGAGAPLLPRELELRVTEVARNGDFACARYDVVKP